MVKEMIIIASAEEVAKAYKDNNVSEKRAANVNEKYSSIPEKFKIYGLIFPDITIKGKNGESDKIIPNVPAFQIHETDSTKYVPVGTFLTKFNTTNVATKITKKGPNENNFMVINNENVVKLAKGLSEAEVVAYCMGKQFTAKKYENFNVFSGKFSTDGKKTVTFAKTAEEALTWLKPKSYPIITEYKE